MTVVRQPIQRAPVERMREKTATDRSSDRGRSEDDQEGPSETSAAELAHHISNLSKGGIQRAARNLGRIARSKVAWESARENIVRSAFLDRFQRGSLRPCMYSQPLPGMLKTLRASARCGLVIAQPLRQKLAPHLRPRPRKGFGYIVEKGDLLDDLLCEAYEEDEEFENCDRLDQLVLMLLEYNRHLGLSEPEALEAAVGQLLFFPELELLLGFQQPGPLEFPAIEAFLELAGLPAGAASSFHWAPSRFAPSDANLPSFGKPFDFSSGAYSARQEHDPNSSDIPAEWVRENVAPEMHNARINADKPYIRSLLAGGRYNRTGGG